MIVLLLLNIWSEAIKMRQLHWYEIMLNLATNSCTCSLSTRCFSEYSRTQNQSVECALARQQCDIICFQQEITDENEQILVLVHLVQKILSVILFCS